MPHLAKVKEYLAPYFVLYKTMIINISCAKVAKIFTQSVATFKRDGDEKLVKEFIEFENRQFFVSLIKKFVECFVIIR